MAVHTMSQYSFGRSHFGSLISHLFAVELVELVEPLFEHVVLHAELASLVVEVITFVTELNPREQVQVQV